MSSAMLPECGGGGRRMDLKDFQRNCGALRVSKSGLAGREAKVQYRAEW